MWLFENVNILQKKKKTLGNMPSLNYIKNLCLGEQKNR